MSTDNSAWHGKPREIVILPAPGCRRSRKILEYLQSRDIPFKRIDLETPEGQALAQRYEMRASPGILIDRRSINPYDVLLKPQCKINAPAAGKVFSPRDDS